LRPFYGKRNLSFSVTLQGTIRVELSAGIKASLAGRYASALFDLASEAGTVTTVESDLENLAAALAESGELRALIKNPEVSRSQLGKVMGGIATHLALSDLTTNFLGVLAENRRVADLPAMIRAFAAIAAAQRGEVNAEIASAHPLTEAQLTELEGKLRAREGRTVKLKSRVDPDLLGGLVVTIGSKRIDNSIRTRLNSLAQAMKSA
jgi:F-type H+-transporting ATPase subunit delta